LLTFWFTNVVNKEERNWRINEPSIKRKEDVHWELYKRSAIFSVINYYTREDKVCTTLKSFRTKKSYIDWANEFLKFTSENEIMFTADVLKILRLFNIYRNKLNRLLNNKIDNINNIEKQGLAYKYLGEFLLSDFKFFSDELKQATRTYFNQKSSEKIIEDEKSFQPQSQEEIDTYLNKLLLYKKTPELEVFINPAIN